MAGQACRSWRYASLCYIKMKMKYHGIGIDGVEMWELQYEWSKSDSSNWRRSVDYVDGLNLIY